MESEMCLPIFLQENGITSYEDLCKKSSAAFADYSKHTERIKALEKRLNEISELQKHIGYYGKTKDVYARYRDSKFSADFFELHRTDLTHHKVAKNYFDRSRLARHIISQ